jgi:hypothetical protein
MCNKKCNSTTLLLQVWTEKFAPNPNMVYNDSALSEKIGSQVNQIIYVLIQIASLNAISKEKLYCHLKN